MKRKGKPVPYHKATGGSAARAEITRLLQSFGCDSVGLMDDFTNHSLLLAFKYRGRAVQMSASAKGWAALYLKANPWKPGSKKPKPQYEREALEHGQQVCPSMLRDWIKGQLTAVECGMVSFDHVFMPYMLTADGRPLIDKVRDEKLLPPPSA